MTIGTLLPDVLAECGIDRASPQITEGTFEMRQVRSLMDTAGKDINRRAEWSKATASFDITNASSITLPADFQEMSDEGAVVLDSAYYSPARPVVSPELWQFLEKFPSEQIYYHLKGGSLFFSSPVTATVRYVSTFWIIGRDAINDNADVPVFPDSLLSRATIWRWKRQKGLPYDDILAEFEADLEAAIKADRGVA